MEQLNFDIYSEIYKHIDDPKTQLNFKLAKKDFADFKITAKFCLDTTYDMYRSKYNEILDNVYYKSIDSFNGVILDEQMNDKILKYIEKNLIVTTRKYWNGDNVITYKYKRGKRTFTSHKVTSAIILDVFNQFPEFNQKRHSQKNIPLQRHITSLYFEKYGEPGPMKYHEPISFEERDEIKRDLCYQFCKEGVYSDETLAIICYNNGFDDIANEFGLYK